MPALVALRGTDCIASEDDGLTWAVISTLPISAAGGVGAGFSGAYYLSANAGAMRSSDAVTWVAAGAHGLGLGARILYNGSIFVAVNPSSDQVSRSVDGGQTWSAPAALPITPRLCGVIGSTFCIRNGSNRATSSDGVIWTTGASGAALPSSGVYTTSFSRNRIVATSAAAGAVNGVGFTADGLTWANGGVAGTSGTFSSIACSGDGQNVVISSNAAKATVRSSDGGVTWQPVVPLTNFPPSPSTAVWVGTGTTFIIPLSSGGICERTTDGGASWSVIPNPGALSIVVADQTAIFMLPGGLPGPQNAFWTNRIKTQETI